MRRERREKIEDNGFRNLMFWAGGVLLVAVIAFGITYAVYSNKVKQESRVSQLNSQKIGELVPSLQTDENTESASLTIGKTVGEMQNTVTNQVTENAVNNQTTQNTNVSNTTNNTINSTANNTTNETTAKEEKTDKEKETKKELSFKMPVEGEIVKNFAKDNLIYSETLKEWITHTGIDIKADKTTVVKAAEEGTVKSIKNDPRYGLTVIIEHEDGFTTVYSNLLTAEFVSEGEKVMQGQTVGTVGTTATFEVADEPHLHFEVLKDKIQVDPTIYLK